MESKEGTRDVTFLDPTAEEVGERVTLSPRLADLNGKVIGLLNISKPGSDIFLARVEELLRERFSPKEIRRWKKSYFSKPAEEGLISEMGESCDAVVEALAD